MEKEKYLGNFSVKSSVRTLRILEIFEDLKSPMTLSEIAKNIDIPKSSAHTLMSTLYQEGYLHKVTGGAYMLNPALRPDAIWVGGMIGAIRRTAALEMDGLLSLFNESVVLGVPSGSCDVKVIDFRQSTEAMSYTVLKSPILPGWCTSLGHAILSNLPTEAVRLYLESVDKIPLTDRTLTSVNDIIERLNKCRSRGYALSIDERFNGACGVAVPIFDLAGRPRAAINMVMLSPNFHERKQTLIDELKSAALRIQNNFFSGSNISINRNFN